MPDPIFISDEPVATDPESEARRLEAEAAAMSAVADWGEWLSKQSETTQALAAEWGERRTSKFTFSERIDRQFRRVYICASEHGHHESLQSHEHALFLLVDSHRVRLEDKPETHARMRGLGHDARTARREAQSVGREIEKTHGRLPIAEHDALVLAEIERREATWAAEEAAKLAPPPEGFEP